MGIPIYILFLTAEDFCYVEKYILLWYYVTEDTGIIFQQFQVYQTYRDPKKFPIIYYGFFFVSAKSFYTEKIYS